MTHTEASSRRRFYRASQLKKQTRNNVLSAPPTGTGLDTGPTPQERGRRLPATASLWPEGWPPRPRSQALHSAHWMEGVGPSRVPFWLPGHLGGVCLLGRWNGLQEFKSCILDTHVLWDTHTSLQDGDFKGAVWGADESRPSLEGPCQPGDQCSLTLWPSSGSAGVPLVPSLPWPRLAFKGTEHVRRVTSCLGDSRTSLRPWGGSGPHSGWVGRNQEHSASGRQGLHLWDDLQGVNSFVKCLLGCGAELVMTITKHVLSGTALGPFLPHDSPGLARWPHDGCLTSQHVAEYGRSNSQEAGLASVQLGNRARKSTWRHL